MKIYLPMAVRSDVPDTGLVANPGIHEASANPQGAVSVIVNGKLLGVKPTEFQVLVDPKMWHSVLFDPVAHQESQHPCCPVTVGRECVEEPYKRSLEFVAAISRIIELINSHKLADIGPLELVDVRHELVAALARFEGDASKAEPEQEEDEWAWMREGSTHADGPFTSRYCALRNAMWELDDEGDDFSGSFEIGLITHARAYEYVPDLEQFMEMIEEAAYEDFSSRDDGYLFEYDEATEKSFEALLRAFLKEHIGSTCWNLGSKGTETITKPTTISGRCQGCVHSWTARTLHPCYGCHRGPGKHTADRFDPLFVGREVPA